MGALAAMGNGVWLMLRLVGLAVTYVVIGWVTPLAVMVFLGIDHLQVYVPSRLIPRTVHRVFGVLAPVVLHQKPP